jgi:hypothetical protein
LLTTSILFCYSIVCSSCIREELETDREQAIGYRDPSDPGRKIIRQDCLNKQATSLEDTVFGESLQGERREGVSECTSSDTGVAQEDLGDQHDATTAVLSRGVELKTVSTSSVCCDLSKGTEVAQPPGHIALHGKVTTDQVLDHCASREEPIVSAVIEQTLSSERSNADDKAAHSVNKPVISKPFVSKWSLAFRKVSSGWLGTDPGVKEFLANQYQSAVAPGRGEDERPAQNTGDVVCAECSYNPSAVKAHASGEVLIADHVSTCQTSLRNADQGYSHDVSSDVDVRDITLCIRALRLHKLGTFSQFRKRRLATCSRQWLLKFLEFDGLDVLLWALDALGQTEYPSVVTAVRHLECVACIRAIMNSQIGLDYIVDNEDFTRKLASGMLRWIMFYV